MSFSLGKAPVACGENTPSKLLRRCPVKSSLAMGEPMPKPRTGQAPPMLAREEFGKRFRIAFYDPAFQTEEAAIARLEEIAWKNYQDDHKAPRTVKAGPGFA